MAVGAVAVSARKEQRVGFYIVEDEVEDDTTMRI